MEPTSSAGLRVLVVDDLEELRTLIHRGLSARGYEVDVAATLAEARGMDPGRYDAVVLDDHLGPERGTDLVKALQSEDPATARRCLVITGGTGDALPDDIAFLAKPFHLDQLIDAVRALHQADAGPAAHRPAGDQRVADRRAGDRRAADRRAGDRRAADRRAADRRGGDRRAGIVPGSGAGRAAARPGDGQTAGEPQAWQLLRLTRRLRARERHELIDFLHDGPIQALTAATLELQMMSRSGAPAPGFEMVIKQLEAAAGSLRWLVDGPWQSVQPETELAPSLQERSAWLLAAPLTVDSDERAADLGAAEVPVIADVVELMLLGMVTASPPAQARVAVRADKRVIEIELTLVPAAGDDQAMGDPAAAQAALDRLAAALGARGDASFLARHWRTRIVLRRQPACGPERSSRVRLATLSTILGTSRS